MHANITELLAARDGELGLASAHISTCQQCQKELKQLDIIAADLKQLPEQDVPEQAWKNILLAHKKSPSQQSLQKTVSLTRAIYALAASILVVGFTLIINTSQPSEPQLNHGLVNNVLPALEAESRALEYTLANYQQNEASLTSAQQFKIEQLQWQLMRVDRKLMISQQQQNIELLEALWAERIKNLNELHVTYNSEQVMRVSQTQRGVL
jgi:hypothetical protein